MFFRYLSQHVAAQPWDQLVEAELIGFVETGDESVGLLRIRRQPRGVDGEEGKRGGESRALVAVDEGMVLRQALPEGGGFLDQVGVIAGLRPVKGGFEQPPDLSAHANPRSARSGRHGWPELRPP